MRNILPACGLFLLLVALPELTVAQCRYVSRSGGGLWSSPDTWTRTGPPSCGAVPESNSVVVINGPVILDQDFESTGTVAALTINPGGSLTEDATPRTITFGQNTGTAIARLTLDAGGELAISTVRFLKSQATLSGSFTSYCTLSLENQTTLTINGRLNILGNLHLTTGNASMRGPGQVVIYGCAVGSNGGLNGLVTPPLSVCVFQRPTSCGSGTCNPNATDIINTNAACNFQTLPVTLVGFTVKYDASRRVMEARWQTAQEENSDRFVLERSSGGRDFSPVATVPAAGNSTTRLEYGVEDTSPLPGESYYRLRQVDRDGQVAYSTVVTAVARAASAPEVYPAEHSGVFVVLLPGTAAGQITVYTMLGQRVLQQAIEGQEPVRLDLRAQPKGHYVAHIQTPDGITIQRVFTF